jgi:hypothetical protein
VRQPTWIIGVLVVIALVYITINTLRTHPAADAIRVGSRLPVFAAPLVTSTLQGDANVATRRVNGVPPACQVRGPRVVNSCQLAARGPVVLAFLATPSQTCVSQVDLLNRLRRSRPGVQFAAVGIRGDRHKLAALVRSHRWRLPVAYDHDGAVANEYGIAVCPTIVFARRGGVVTGTLRGFQPAGAVLRELERAR